MARAAISTKYSSAEAAPEHRTTEADEEEHSPPPNKCETCLPPNPIRELRSCATRLGHVVTELRTTDFAARLDEAHRG